MLSQIDKLRYIHREVEMLSKQLTSITFYKPELEEQLKELDEYRYLLRIVIDNIDMYEKEDLNKIIKELVYSLKILIKSIEGELNE